MEHRPIWFIIRMIKAHYKEIEQLIGPIMEQKNMTPKNKSWKVPPIPKHLRRPDKR